MFKKPKSSPNPNIFPVSGKRRQNKTSSEEVKVLQQAKLLISPSPTPAHLTGNPGDGDGNLAARGRRQSCPTAQSLKLLGLGRQLSNSAAGGPHTGCKSHRVNHDTEPQFMTGNTMSLGTEVRRAVVWGRSPPGWRWGFWGLRATTSLEICSRGLTTTQLKPRALPKGCPPSLMLF